MKKKEIIEQVTGILNGNGKLTPTEIHQRIKGELPMVQVFAALKSMLDSRTVNIEEHGKTKFYYLTKKVTKTNEETIASKRDTTKYEFNGLKDLSKGRLALAIVKQYCDIKRPSLQNLVLVFPDSIVKPYGMIRTLSEAIEASKERKRFFTNKDDVITLASGEKVCVSNQFTTERIAKVISICERELSLKITPRK